MKSDHPVAKPVDDKKDEVADKGFITLAVGDEYLQRAAAFALSAKRFGYPTILMHAGLRTVPGQPDRLDQLASLFHRCVRVDGVPVTNQKRPHTIWELKKLCYEHSAEFDACAYVDADSLLIRDPRQMFRLSMKQPVQTPGGRAVRDDETWSSSGGVTTRRVASALGVPAATPLQTLNGGFLIWHRCDQAQRWFEDFARLFGRVIECFKDQNAPANSRCELCMSLAFARAGISLSHSDSSIGVWDASNLDLDIERQRFTCKKSYYWEGHRFRPYIAHFGGSSVSRMYRDSVRYLSEAGQPIDLPLFTDSSAKPPVVARRPAGPEFNGFSISEQEYDGLVQFARQARIRRVLEFGPGASTWAFVEAGCEVVSLEYQQKWFEHYRREFAQHPQVQVIQFHNQPTISVPQLREQQFDLGFVDSPVGALYKHYARMNACEFVADRTNRWMLHDAQRAGERNTLSAFQGRGWVVEYLEQLPKTAIASRDASLRCVAPRLGYDLDHWPELPIVSCQCITYGRPHLLNEAVESFLRQDYVGKKELVILNDHPRISIEPFDHPDVRVVNVGTRFRSIGEKRNACCGLCRGQVIFPWDDDDISLPSRISFTLQEMKNRAYFKPDSFWFLGAGGLSVRRGIAHAMGAWSRDLFDQVRGYPHIQSGQDQAIEKLFEQTGKRSVTATPTDDLFYIYRFPGTGSYHLSAFGYGKGLEETEQYVARHVAAGCYRIDPTWKQDYVAMVHGSIARASL